LGINPLIMPTSNQRATNLIIKGLLILFLLTVALPVRMTNYVIRVCSKRNRKASPIFYLLLIGHFTVAAQGFSRFAGNHQMGLESTFGLKSFDIRSNIAEINTLHVQLEGGTLGVVLGSKSVVLKIRQGFYYSSASVAHTIDEVKSEVLLNFYPTYFIKKESRLKPYMLIDMERNIFRMHGFYAGEDQTRVNHSLSLDPHLGNVSTIQAGVGAGLEHRIKSQTHFVAFFGEAKYCQPIRMSSSNQLFAETKLSSQLLLSVGISFGYYRYELRGSL
jgi:hypothetical protein